MPIHIPNYYAGMPAPEKPKHLARALKDGPTKVEQRRMVSRGVCPTCRRAMVVTRTGPRSALAVCPKCGGEGHRVSPHMAAWRNMT